MHLVKTLSGKQNLLIWRGGFSYEAQKGQIYRREWNNLLFTTYPQPPKKKDLHYYDIRKPLPYPDQIFDAVYLFHILEHLTPEEGSAFLREIYRVLKFSGIVRISTPDLEDICRAYFSRLKDYEGSSTEKNLLRYEWSVLELLDQIVRVHSGGLIKEYATSGHYDPPYARERYRDVFDEFSGPRGKERSRLVDHIRQLTPRRIKAILRLLKGLYDPTGSGQNFRDSGEVNKWLYDHFSMTMLLEKTAFRQVSRKTYRMSDIPEWDRFNLDCSIYGDYPIEPSLYIEARKALHK
jgi:SAM-dependent methyltransferase